MEGRRLNRGLNVAAAIRRLRTICVEQAPVLAPAAVVVFIVTAALATVAAAFIAAATLVIVVLYLAWASRPG